MPNFEYSSKKARALSAQTRKSRPSMAIFEEKLPVKAVQVKTAVAIKV
jgi:hypothetical protein